MLLILTDSTMSLLALSVNYLCSSSERSILLRTSAPHLRHKQMSWPSSKHFSLVCLLACAGVLGRWHTDSRADNPLGDGRAGNAARPSVRSAHPHAREWTAVFCESKWIVMNRNVHGTLRRLLLTRALMWLRVHSY